jgi:hypothetical protein
MSSDKNTNGAFRVWAKVQLYLSSVGIQKAYSLVLVNGAVYSFIFPTTIVLNDDRLLAWYKPISYIGIYALLLAMLIILINLNLMKRRNTSYSLKMLMTIILLFSGFIFLFQIALIVPAILLFIAGGTQLYSIIHE